MSPYLTIGVIGVAALICIAANCLPFLVLSMPGRCSGAELLLAVIIAVGADLVFGLGISRVVKGR